VILMSWGIAFEYWLAVPVNLGAARSMAPDSSRRCRKSSSLIVFAGFSVLYLK
jgi:uncharacterized protein (DUF486 family)